MELSLEKIEFGYGSNPVIKGVDCEFKSGNFYSVIGPNGSGKTTLLDLISGFLTPSSGGITIDKSNIKRFSKIIWQGFQYLLLMEIFLQ